MNIQELLKIGIKKLKDSQIENPINIAKRLMCYTIKKDKIYLITHMEEEITQEQEHDYLEYISKIQNHMPIQYIVQNQEFMKMDFFVNENVLIPRQDTEIVVEEAIKIINKNKLEKIFDVCTGSGAIIISIAKYTKASNLVAIDISTKALEIAQKNAISNNVNNRIKFIQSNMFENVKEKYDLIISNPPYIKTAVIQELDEEVKKEPIIALDGGNDGLNFYKIIAENAKKYLNTNGYLVLEIGYDQKEEVINLLRINKYKDIQCIKDFGNNDRVIICKI